MSSRAPPVPRLAIAACLGLTAIALEALRRYRRGPVRSTPPTPNEIPHLVSFGRGHCDVDTVNQQDLINPPITREDPFFWMRDDDRKAEPVLQHLREENAYTNFKTLHLRSFASALYKELLSHYIETDSTVPAPRDGPKGKFAYYTKTQAGKSYKFYCRRLVNADGSLGDEDILLDINALAKGLKHCDVLACEVSPDDKYLAYTVDTQGYEFYEIRFLDLQTRDLLPNASVKDTTGSFSWGLDSSTIFYNTMDEAHRPHKLWRREGSLLEASQQPATFKHSCLFTETDTEYNVYSRKSRSNRFLIISSVASMTSEHRVLDLQSKDQTVRLVRERSQGVLYDVSHGRGDDFYIITNLEGATNFELMRTNVNSLGTWSPFLPYDEARKIDYITSFENFAVMVGRQGGYKQIWILPDHDVKNMYVLPTEDDAHFLQQDTNLEYSATTFRYVYSSLTKPRRVCEIDMRSKDIEVLKLNEVPNYDESLYGTEVLEATSKDGTKVPVSLVYKKGVVPEGSPRKVLLYGYGSYEISMNPSFSMTRFPLLDRGVLYAIAHVRGGGEYGRGWYEAARMENKKKTFEDFIACGEMLVDTGRTKAEWMAMEGRSAGGMLVGAVANMRPDLFRAAVAGVPFVDVLSTMSDASIPLTTGEWQEWGNPHVEKYYKSILEYCPYSNVGKKDYPAMLVLAGLYDPRVMYSEPAKWVSKLRKMSTSDRDILLKVDLSSGHFSSSNRYHYLKELAFEMGWVLNELDAMEVSDVPE